MKSYRKLSRLFFVVVITCLTAAIAHAQPAVTQTSFGKTASGENVDLYTLRNIHGVEATITNYGGIVVSLKVPDRNGKFDDVVLGFKDFEGYLKNDPYFGALIGRYG